MHAEDGRQDGARNASILVVDDNLVNRKLAVASLATMTQICPMTLPSPVMMLPQGQSPSYISNPANCENSRNGEPGSIS